MPRPPRRAAAAPAAAPDDAPTLVPMPTAHGPARETGPAPDQPTSDPTQE